MYWVVRIKWSAASSCRRTSALQTAGDSHDEDAGGDRLLRRGVALASSVPVDELDATDEEVGVLHDESDVVADRDGDDAAVKSAPVTLRSSVLLAG